MQSLVDTPKKSLLLVPEVVNDTRLGSQKQRWTISIIYGLLRRTFNLSLNNISSYYSHKYHDIYLINRIDTLKQRSGFGRNTIIKDLNILEKYGYIYRHNNKIKHLDYIFMPKVMKDHLTKPNILNGYNLVGLETKPGRFKNQTRQVYKVNRGGLKSKPRCKDHMVNDQIVRDHDVHVQSNTTKRKLSKWINNYGLPKSVVDLVKSNSKSINDALTKVKDITRYKNTINMKYKGIYYSNYFKNENNPYIQNGGLIKSLKAVFNDHKNLKETVTNDYQNYIDDNSNLKLKNSKKPKNNGLAIHQKTSEEKISAAQNQIKLLHNGMKHAKTDTDKHKIQDQIQHYGHVIIDNCTPGGEMMWDIKYTREWHENTDLHPTNPKLVKKVERQVEDLKHRDNNDHYTDANGEEHITTNHHVFDKKPNINTTDMDEIEKEIESDDTGKESETVPPLNDQRTGTDDDYNPF